MDESAISYPQLKAAFKRWLECDPAARPTLLETLRHREPALAAALERRIRASERGVGLLDSAPQPVSFPRYRTLGEIGRGGFGRVWLAERSDGTYRQRVAIKQLDREVWSEQDIAAIVRERQILAELNHPLIAKLLDGGVDSRGVPFLATEYVAGQRLDHWCDQHRADLRTRVDLVARICTALAHAHQRLIVHRDIKPANLLVDADGVPRVLDFGIARLLGDENPATAEDRAILTLRYAAPEQIDGKRAGIAADVYALGVVLYELLAGVSPYGEIRDPSRLIAAVLQEDPPPPSLAARRHGGGRQIPGDLDAICLRALRKHPESRYPSMEAFGTDLERWLGGEPVIARHAERGYRLRVWWRRYWPRVAVIGILTALSLTYQFHLEQQLRKIEREHEKSRAIAGFFVDLFRALPPGKTRSGETSARALLEIGVGQLRDRPGLEGPARFSLLLAVAKVHMALGLFREADELYSRAADSLDGIAGLTAAEEAELWRDYGTAKMRLGDMQELYDFAQRGLALIDASPPHVELRTALLVNAVLGAHLLGRADLAERPYREAIARLERSAPRIDKEQFRLFNGLGVVACQQRRFLDCRKVFQKLLTEARRLDPRDPDVELPLAQNVATAERDLGRYGVAQRAFTELLTELRAHRGEQDVRLAFVLRDAAINLLMLGESGAAAASLAEAKTIVGAQLEPTHPEMHEIRLAEAIMTLRRGDPGAALLGLPHEDGGSPPSSFETIARRAAECLTAPGLNRLKALDDAIAEHAEGLPPAAWRLQLAAEWRHGCQVAQEAHATSSSAR